MPQVAHDRRQFAGLFDHFVSRCTPEEPGLVFTFYESPEVLVEVARKRGIDLAPLISSGALHVIWNAPTEHDLDEPGFSLLGHVRAHGTRRVVLDGIDAFEKVVVEPGRLNRFLTAWNNELRSPGCTSVYLAETTALFGNEAHLLAGNRSSIGQNILMLRYVQDGPPLIRTLAVIKVRERDSDQCTHEFRLIGEDVEIGRPFDPQLRPVMGEPDDGDLKA